MIDRDGKTYDLPDVFQTEIVAPGVVRYLKTAGADALWGLYDFVAKKELAAPAFRKIGHFQNGQAVASLGADRVGVIDQQGQWVLPASHYGIARVNDKLWRVMQAGGQGEDYERPAAVFNAQGRALTSFQRLLQRPTAPACRTCKTPPIPALATGWRSAGPCAMAIWMPRAHGRSAPWRRSARSSKARPPARWPRMTQARV
ncbi:hypothetical protein G6F68_013454 [Rhizopus microsporus]|nr:hypothetical protein G6F68_013454 [Rhizopus microsporus]